MAHKKYALLKSGNIVPLYYDEEKTELRRIEKEGNFYYLYYDKYFFENDRIKYIVCCKERIIKEADTMEELRC